ncbi:hypothetical protein [Dyella sp. GSA-30]|uniref:hypothetical protein n=1 Tax=Dyella sp. GSA-30 TaxID=2994496 RepID=UPI0024908017|nr:hypothetical protein [Dyella sp. GSA-30]
MEDVDALLRKAPMTLSLPLDAGQQPSHPAPDFYCVAEVRAKMPNGDREKILVVEPYESAVRHSRERGVDKSQIDAAAFEAFIVPMQHRTEVPKVPKPGQARIVLTADFSGCTFSAIEGPRYEGKSDKLVFGHLVGGQTASGLRDMSEGRSYSGNASDPKEQITLSKSITHVAYPEYGGQSSNCAFMVAHHTDNKWHISVQSRVLMANVKAGDVTASARQEGLVMTHAVPDYDRQKLPERLAPMQRKLDSEQGRKSRKI